MSEPKVMLVTGGSKGIGAAIAQHHARLGYRVFATSRSAKPELPAGIEWLALEVGDERSVERCIGELLQHAGRIDVLVNNAGFDLYGALEETAMNDFVQQVDINLFGAVRMMKAVLPPMRAQRSGRIVNVSSLGGRIGLPMNGAYAASKFALEGVSESVRLEMLPHGVYVSLIAPGAVSTDTLDESIREVALTSGPFAARRREMVRRMRAVGLRSAVKPEHVARAVERACEDRVPRLRYPVGAQGTWIPRMKAAMPQAGFENFMRRIFG